MKEIPTQIDNILEDYYKNRIDLLGVRKRLLQLINGNVVMYAFTYNNSLCESQWVTVSIHRSEYGAIKAMNEHKQKALEEFNEIYGEYNPLDIKFGEDEGWVVEPITILP